MLALAARERDVRETAGQLFRILLVPLGHLSGRLPLGNPGRARACPNFCVNGSDFS